MNESEIHEKGSKMVSLEVSKLIESTEKFKIIHENRHLRKSQIKSKIKVVIRLYNTGYGSQ